MKNKIVNENTDFESEIKCSENFWTESETKTENEKSLNETQYICIEKQHKFSH